LRLSSATGSKKLPNKENKMSRMFVGLLMIMMFAASGFAADLVSMKLCPAAYYDAVARDCVVGKGIEGKSVQVDPKVGSLLFLTAVKTSKDEAIYHVWISGKTVDAVTVYDTATKTLRDADESEMAWLKERNIEGARAIVRMTASASPKFRLRSGKTLPVKPGVWKVQVYDEAQVQPLGEMEFTMTPDNKGITD